MAGSLREEVYPKVRVPVAAFEVKDCEATVDVSQPSTSESVSSVIPFGAVQLAEPTDAPVLIAATESNKSFEPVGVTLGAACDVDELAVLTAATTGATAVSAF
jgi:hypothetical protein